MAITEEQSVYLRCWQGKYGAFFEKFVTAEDNWLPPDNYQEDPVERIAHRTSPTNIGLHCSPILRHMILAILQHSQFIERTSNTIQYDAADGTIQGAFV